MYEVAIIGAGPAGVSAAINLKLLNKNFIWIAGQAESDKAARAELVKNYPGLPDITGKQLCWALKEHAAGMGAKITEGVVTGVYDTVGKFTLLVGNEQVEAKSVILCTGVVASKPLEGEDNFLGRGVSYCATCDGFLYKDKTIAVISYAKNFEHEIDYLAGIAKKVFVLPMYKDADVAHDNCEVLQVKPTSIEGGLKAQKLNIVGGQLQIDGIFILRSAISPATLFRGLETDGGHIVVDRNCATNISGVYAAGDCTGAPYQYTKAVGEGNIAAHSAVKYLADK